MVVLGEILDAGQLADEVDRQVELAQKLASWQREIHLTRSPNEWSVQAGSYLPGFLSSRCCSKPDSNSWAVSAGRRFLYQAVKTRIIDQNSNEAQVHGHKLTDFGDQVALEVQNLERFAPFVQMFDSKWQRHERVLPVVSLPAVYFSMSCWCREISSRLNISPSLCSARRRTISSVTTSSQYVSAKLTEMTSVKRMLAYFEPCFLQIIWSNFFKTFLF